MVNEIWSNKLPTKEGKYWFYGELWNPNGKPEPELEIIDVKKISNGFCYISHGTFVYEGEGMQGLWLKMQEPKLPTNFKYEFNERYFWCDNPKCKSYHKDWFQE
ncbi:MAG: hypothetical protein WC389_13900 [Lutibacter sp.]|jgi:hypothetical protein